MAAENGHLLVCQLIIRNADDKNSKTNNGLTPLHLAAKNGHLPVCELIIENVDDKNPAALNGCTLLHLAAKEGHLDIVRLIVETGVDKNTLFNGQTPFDMASSFKSFTFYKLLSKDKFQLCGIIFKDLHSDVFFLFLSFFFCVWFVMI